LTIIPLLHPTNIPRLPGVSWLTSIALLSIIRRLLAIGIILRCTILACIRRVLGIVRRWRRDILLKGLALRLVIVEFLIGHGVVTMGQDRYGRSTYGW
jgi:hypothetical protein